VVRLRLRDLTGRVVFSDDGSGLGESDEDDEVVEAAGGETVAVLTHLNTDDNDVGPAGARVVEIYLVLNGGAGRIGVLEIYLPYAPIDADVTTGLRALYLILGMGLVAL
jgi:hypothetical protein